MSTLRFLGVLCGLNVLTGLTHFVILSALVTYWFKKETKIEPLRQKVTMVHKETGTKLIPYVTPGFKKELNRRGR